KGAPFRTRLFFHPALMLRIYWIRCSTAVRIDRQTKSLQLLCGERKVTRRTQLQVRPALECPRVPDRDGAIGQGRLDSTSVEPRLTCTCVHQLDITLVENVREQLVV